GRGTAFGTSTRTRVSETAERRRKEPNRAKETRRWRGAPGGAAAAVRGHPAERSLGPQLYGVFPEGRLEQYIPVRARPRPPRSISFPSPYSPSQWNILLLSEPENADGLMLVDFEYSSYNYRGFDIGNHFCEWVYDYTHEEWPFYKAQPANYPTRGQQLHFIRHYLAEVKKGETISREEQRKLEADLLAEANRYALASHFFWGLWSILQASMSTIEFGYLEYAQSRFQFYFQQKGQLTSFHPSS
ncbi:hypothetical protein E2I00_004729, partial [Balaenoptera physalus]